MDRDDAIGIIDALYPTDSEFEGTNQIGAKLLAQAKTEVRVSLTWRNEPTKVLVRYAELCEQYARAGDREFIRQHA